MGLAGWCVLEEPPSPACLSRHHPPTPPFAVEAALTSIFICGPPFFFLNFLFAERRAKSSPEWLRINPALVRINLYFTNALRLIAVPREPPCVRLNIFLQQIFIEHLECLGTDARLQGLGLAGDGRRHV